MTSTQSTTEHNRAVVEAAYTAVSAGDVEGLFDNCHDDVTVSEPAFLPFGRVYRGKEEFLQLFPAITRYLDVSKVEVHFVIADHDRAVGCIGMPDLKSGAKTLMLELFTLREGKIAEIQLFYYDAGSMVPIPTE